jgi:hypothetical protein
MEVPATVIPAHPEGEGKTAPNPSGSWPVDTPGGRFHAEWDDQAPSPAKASSSSSSSSSMPAGDGRNSCAAARSTTPATVAAAHATSWAPPCSASSAAIGATPTSTRCAATASTPACWHEGHCQRRCRAARHRAASMRSAASTGSPSRSSAASLPRSGPAVDPRHRRYRQAPLRPPTGCPNRLQPAKARSPQPRLPQLLRRQPAHQPRRGSAPRQRTRRRQRAARALADLGKTPPPPMAHLHPRRLRLRQRDHHVGARATRLPYLFKLRHTAKVKDLVIRMMRQGADWLDCGDGWQALETALRLNGWSKERRVILVREAPATAPVRKPGKSRRGKDRQSHLPQRQRPRLGRLRHPVERQDRGARHQS